MHQENCQALREASLLHRLQNPQHVKGTLAIAKQVKSQVTKPTGTQTSSSCQAAAATKSATAWQKPYALQLAKALCLQLQPLCAHDLQTSHLCRRTEVESGLAAPMAWAPSPRAPVQADPHSPDRSRPPNRPH